MARTIITPAAQPGAYDDALVRLTPVAADTANGNRVVMAGDKREGIIAWNDGVTARTVTVTSVADGQNRVEHIAAVTLDAGGFYLFPEFQVEGWQQPDGYLYFKGSHADVKFLVWRRP